MRAHAAEHAGAEIRAPGAHREKRERVAEREPRRGADDAERPRFDEHQPRDATALEPQHAQQGVLTAPPRRLQRLGRENQEAAGEERDQREHIEVHPVGARRIGARLLERFDRRGIDAGRKEALDGFQHGVAVRPARNAHLQPIELAEPPEAPLRGGDVDERRLAAQRRLRQDARHGELERSLSDDEAQVLALAKPERRGRGSREERPVRREELVAILSRERRLQQRRAQDVDADHAQRALGAGEAGIELEHRARDAHAGELRDLRIERLGKAAAGAAHLDVGFAG